MIYCNRAKFPQTPRMSYVRKCLLRANFYYVFDVAKCKLYIRGQKLFLMTASGSLDIYLTRLLRMKLFLQFSYKAISNTM